MLNDCPAVDEWHRGVSRGFRWPAVLGFSILLIGGLGFGTWAAVAPLDGAVVASGTFVVTGQNKQIQHLEGGIVHSVLVREGQLVDAGQTLIRIDDTAARARLRRLNLRHHRLLLLQAGLDAELHGKDLLVMPPKLAGLGKGPEIALIFNRQQAELAARRVKSDGDQEVLRREIASIEESIGGFRALELAARTRVTLFNDEIEGKMALIDQGLVRKSDLLSLRRAQAGTLGDAGELTGRIADARARVGRAMQEIVQVKSTNLQKVGEELRQTESEIDDVEEQIRAAEDIVNRTDVRAPVPGIVVKMNYHTTGGVLSPGAVILEMLPVNDELLIEARVNPNDINHVVEGQSALVRLTSLNQRTTPMIKGTVAYLSADTVKDTEMRSAQELNGGGRQSFVIRVSLDKKDALANLPDFRPMPGMPADLFIKTGERTFMEYILRPVHDSLARSFREH